jgi:Right handed beta helix region
MWLSRWRVLVCVSLAFGGSVVLAQVAHAATTLYVGPSRAIASPSAAAAITQAGDTVLIDPGVYSGDVATWAQDGITLRGNGGRVVLDAKDAQGVVRDAQGKGIWVISGSNVTVENVEFRNASVPDQNGAGIRSEGAGLTVRDSAFVDNENGILAGAIATSDIVIERSEFANNGFGDGQSHAIYIGAVRSFTLRSSWSHGTRIGHNVKSRAATTIIEYNRIDDGPTGTASYEIDLPSAGNARIVANVIQQGPLTDNSTIVAYGEEGGSQPGRSLDIVNNTFVNDLGGSGTFVRAVPADSQVRLINNAYLGDGTIYTGPSAVKQGNLVVGASAVVDRATLDLRPTAGSPLIDAAVSPPVAVSSEYRHPASSAARSVLGAVDTGAFEYTVATVPPVEGLRYTPLRPVRVVDTRDGTGGVGRLEPSSPTRVGLATRLALPSARAVALHVTVVGPQADGFISVYPCGPLPTVSNLNFQAGPSAETNLAVVGLDSDGGVCVASSARTNFVLDVAGYFSVDGLAAFRRGTPSRLIDTRTGSGGRLAANETRTLSFPTGTAPSAAVLNITTVNPGEDGFLTVYPCQGGLPIASQSNPRRGGVKANLVMASLDASRNVCIYTKQPVDLIVDVFGTWEQGSGELFVPVTPNRLVDTRNADALFHFTSPDQSVTLPMPGSGSFVARSAFLNLTTVNTKPGGTFVTGWPCDTRPTTSNVNSLTPFPVANAAVVFLSTNHAVCLFSSQPTDFLVDIFGWLVDPDAAQ